MYSPFEDSGDDLLSVVCQLQIFFSLLSKIILQTNPNDPVMSVLLPMMLGVPPLAGFVFESGVLDELQAAMAAVDNGVPIPFSGGKRIGVGLRSHLNAKLERFMGVNPAGTLQVRLLAAKGLEAAGGGTPDPYIVATLEDGEKQTAAVARTHDPTFDETLEFDVAALDATIANGLTLTVYDKNVVSSDEQLGEVVVPLEALRKHAKVPPRSAAVSETGSVTYSLHFIKDQRGMDGVLVAGSPSVRRIFAKPYLTPRPSGTLKVHLHTAASLPPADGETSDPYVVARLGDSEKQSAVVAKTI